MGLLMKTARTGWKILPGGFVTKAVIAGSLAAGYMWWQNRNIEESREAAPAA